MSKSDRLKQGDIKKLEETECVNSSGLNSNLLLSLDGIGQALLPYIVEYRSYGFIQGGVASNDKIIAVRKKLDAVSNLFAMPGLELPSRAAVREAFAEAYHLFNPEHELGKGCREVIKKAFEVLELEPIRDIQAPAARKAGKRTKGGK